MRKITTIVLAALAVMMPARAAENLRLDSVDGHGGNYKWQMCRVSSVAESGEALSLAGYPTTDWQKAVVPGTVLNSLVYNGELPDPYYGMTNKLESNMIPDITKVGRDYYTYWFRTEFDCPASYEGQQVWLSPDGINYRAEFWLNGHLVVTVNGMFVKERVNITEYIRPGSRNALAVKVLPVDEPGTTMPKTWGAIGEFHNGGNGAIGVNTTMLMTVGWDFTFMDGIRDRNTGIWRSVNIYATGAVDLRNPFVQSELSHPSYDLARETVSVEVANPSMSMTPVEGEIVAEILGEGILARKHFTVIRGGVETVTFSPEDFPQLEIRNPRLWWPVNKGPQEMYKLRLRAYVEGELCDTEETEFGIREIVSDQNTPDNSRVFYVNGQRLFVRGSNWIPEAMLRTDDARMDAELRMTSQTGINLLRLWGGGIAESDRFYELCDKYGILVWTEFWMTGDTRHPQDAAVYRANVESTVKRIRNHPSQAYYVASNESSEMPGMRPLIESLDPTRGYQMQSECDGIHDGSPYKQVNPMQHYENTASARGSRIDGFNPEYGAPTVPIVESLRQLMDEKDLWPINKEVWNYLDGNGFHLMTTLYTDMVNNYGEATSIDDYAKKGQLVGAMNSKSIWEVWNENKLDYGDRFCSGLLFWYHNNANPQVCGRMWDWYLEPTASLYHTMHSLEPLHVQYDYLKNTVSVINDYYKAFEGLTVEARVYDFNSKVVATKKAVGLSIASDGVLNDVLALAFPASISKVHFIYLTLKDAAGKVLSTNFYWRSTDEYEGKTTVTGPCTSGFESLPSLAKTSLRAKVAQSAGEGVTYVDIQLRNTTSKIAFFNQLQILGADGKPIRPAYFTDNFFTLVPGESLSVRLEVASDLIADGATLVLKGWNSAKDQKFPIR